MRKTVLFITLLLGIFYCLIAHASGLENSGNSNGSGFFKKYADRSTIHSQHGSGTSLAEKVFTDNDTDEENEDNHELSLKKTCFLHSFPTLRSFQNNQIHSFKSAASDFYFFENLSRIPRYSYLTLNVFRI